MVQTMQKGRLLFREYSQNHSVLLGRSIFLGGIFCSVAHVQLLNGGNSGTAEANLHTVAGGFQNKGIILIIDSSNAANNTTNGNNGLAYFNGSAHGSIFLVLLFLGQVQDDVHEHKDQNHRQESDKQAGGAGSISGQKFDHNVELLKF